MNNQVALIIMCTMYVVQYFDYTHHVLLLRYIAIYVATQHIANSYMNVKYVNMQENVYTKIYIHIAIRTKLSNLKIMNLKRE